MSQDRNTAPETSGTPYPRCKKQPGERYTLLYMGTQRHPSRPDEKGAIAVVDLVFGGRALIFRIDGDPEHRRVLLKYEGATR